MRRYADELRGSRDPIDAEMLRLLDAAEPIEASLARKPRRVAEVRGAGRLPGGARWAVRFAMAMTLLAATAAGARAALGHWPTWSMLLEHLAPSHRAPARPEPAAPVPTRAPVQAPSPAALEEAPAPATRPAVRSHALVARPHNQEVTARAKAIPAERPHPGEEKILAAVRALRRDHDPGQARRLVSGYLQEQPEGALVEEARALEVEAAAVRRDGDTRALADAYLQRYPQGAFRARVMRAVREMDDGRP